MENVPIQLEVRLLESRYPTSTKVSQVVMGCQSMTQFIKSMCASVLSPSTLCFIIESKAVWPLFRLYRANLIVWCDIAQTCRAECFSISIAIEAQCLSINVQTSVPLRPEDRSRLLTHSPESFNNYNGPAAPVLALQ
eukprot:258641-Amphidinium_carterae.3